MRLSTLVALPLAAASKKTAKRGLVFVPTEDHPSDNAVWVQKGSPLTWYYNYRDIPSSAFAGVAQEKFEFVPMMYSVDEDDPSKADFLSKVEAMIDDNLNITHALSFNEPDSPASAGGTEIEPAKAAEAWVSNFEPLREKGVRVGLPACSAQGGGLQWLESFVEKCAEVLSEGEDERKNCSWDFLPVHWYGSFPGLASHVGKRLAAFPDTPIWVTEYAFSHQDLVPTQEFYNKSIEWLEEEDFIERYSYFGAFRAEDSKIGPNVAFLNQDGDLTDIGSWYLGGNATGVDPRSGDGAAGEVRSPLGLVLLLAGAAALGMA